MPQKLALFLVFVLIAASRFVHAADCVACTKVSAERQLTFTEEESSRDLLAKNKAVLLQISPGDMSKKVKLTSNILILTAKSEKAANQRTVLEQQFVTMGCATCPK